MPSRPTGTVTFLFTDIEGSTRLLQQIGDARSSQLLSEHRRLILAGVATGGGYTYQDQSESFLVAFQSARDAVLTALEVQRAANRHPWPEDAALRVRMGLHTAEVSAVEGEYVGLGIHKAARICAAASGGQVLLSQTTGAVLENDFPEGVTLKYLGEYRLKDLQQPERLFQLVHPDLPQEFPRLRTLDYRPHNLPRQLTSFIGREVELAEVNKRLSTTGLLTLTGGGGSGKTRLALQVAAEMIETFPDGVWQVELASLSEPSLLAQTASAALDVREQYGRPMLDTLVDFLQPRELLLILDNCEHLVDACAHLAGTLLQACPQVRILATSREPLAVPGETTWRVPSLALRDPDRAPPEALLSSEAARLFVDRARAVERTFAITTHTAQTVARICQRLDGIPLAIELAAALVRVLTLDQILARLNDAFRLLKGAGRGTLPRQQTLRATMDWSYNLLGAAERALLGRLSVFAGGFALESVEDVCAGDTVEKAEVFDLLRRLVDKSWVASAAQEATAGSPQDGAAAEESRYWLLETIRQYAAQKLREEGAVTEWHRRHRDHFLAVAENAEPRLHGADQIVWLARLESELDNVRAAMDWCRKADEGQAWLRIAGALWWFYAMRGSLNEGLEWLGAALDADPAGTLARAKALYGAAALAWNRGELERAVALGEEALTLSRALGDEGGIAYCLSILALVPLLGGEYEQAAVMLEQALSVWRQRGQPWEQATALAFLGQTAYSMGDFQRASQLCEESLALFTRVGDRWGIALALTHLGEAISGQGDDRRAAELTERSIALSREMQNRPMMAWSLFILSRIVRRHGDPIRARSLIRESLTLRWDQGEQWGVAECLESFADVEIDDGAHRRAACLLGAATALRETIGFPLPVADRASHARQLAALKDALGEEAFTAAWSEGQRMSVRDIVAFALEQTAVAH